MARGIERIEQDITSLEEVIEGIGEELQEVYGGYVENLGKSVSKQLILAIYHLCTQGYPDNFLKLSLNQKQKLQQNIRKLGQRSDSELKELLKVDDEEDEEDGEYEKENADEEKIQIEEISDEQILEITTDGNIKITADLPLTEAELAAAMDSIAKAARDKTEEEKNKAENNDKEQDKSESVKESGELSEVRLDEVVLVNASIADKAMDLFAAARNAASKYPSKPKTLDTSNPVELAKWQQYLELSLQQLLRVVSRDANRILQKSRILPKKLPPSLLEAAAASSEASAEIMPGPPNLLNLAIEIESEQKSDSSRGLMKIMAVNLRLGEIEFADTELSAKRKKIRNISSRLAKVGREYQKIQRELSVAKAEAAWRSSWYED
ncbi:hypothetical protein [Mastigocoleus testarum]|uniref:Primosomal protein n=1 Tax=Mastigocoleus testarum BC008 TaxID=371196 RepID=A0A0V7ZX82_9CYAN|nr:hypothetical protein [Mastigocoleus testarum]KST69112.1 hypothetical protein BC008_34935 [Mastigocoleus testarum BC008]